MASQRTAVSYCWVCGYQLGGTSCRLARFERITKPGVSAYNAYHADGRDRQLREYYRMENRKAKRAVPLAAGSFLYTLERER